ncbi:MAG TPA: pyruvate kinase [Firmicutes bacterium]|nr:pyruvate kinase [Bacillota bacterium]
MRKTKIVCTIGPASDSPEVIGKLIDAGMNVARINFSHGTREEHLARLKTLRRVAEEKGAVLGIMQDIQGPKIRIGDLPGKVMLEVGQTFIITTEECVGSRDRVSVNYPKLPQDVRPGNVIYLDDGLLKLEVTEVKSNDVYCQVAIGGELSSRKGVTLPGVSVDLPAVTEADIEDIKFGVKHGVDMVAASFVRTAEGVETVREAIRSAGADIPVIAKIENHEGVENIDEIIEAADGIMVARGDMGVEMRPEDVPFIQKMIISKCNEAGKPVITATQMLDSMIRNARPTRAEVTDVASAILDGTDAVMLSGETAVGKYPVLAVETMSRIAERAEQSLDREKFASMRNVEERLSIAEAISYATWHTCRAVNAAAIICATQSGSTARMVSRYRPDAPILAMTPHEQVVRQLALVWGVYPVLVPPTSDIDGMIDVSIKAALRSGLVSKGDIVTISAGVLTDKPGSTNLLQVYVVE